MDLDYKDFFFSLRSSSFVRTELCIKCRHASVVVIKGGSIGTVFEGFRLGHAVIRSTFEYELIVLLESLAFSTGSVCSITREVLCLLTRTLILFYLSVIKDYQCVISY